jgi:hypothetical protein
LRFTPDGNFLERSCEPSESRASPSILGDHGGAMLGPQPGEITI